MVPESRRLYEGRNWDSELGKITVLVDIQTQLNTENVLKLQIYDRTSSGLMKRVLAALVFLRGIIPEDVLLLLEKQDQHLYSL